MDKLDYIEKLHDLAYQANLADVPELREEWQKPEHARDHAQPFLNMVNELLDDNEDDYQVFLDTFGDFDAFRAHYKRRFTFGDTVLSVLAYLAGETFSKAQNVPGQRFMGSMNIADAMGYERDSVEWDGAIAGAMSHINTLDVVTDTEGVLI